MMTILTIFIHKNGLHKNKLTNFSLIFLSFRKQQNFQIDITHFESFSRSPAASGFKFRFDLKLYLKTKTNKNISAQRHINTII